MENFLGYLNLGAAFFLLIGMALLLGRLLAGPTLYDRILGCEFIWHKNGFIFVCVLANHWAFGRH